MLARTGLNSVRVFTRRSIASQARCLTTKNSIVDHTTNKTIKLSDPNHPEYGDYPIYKAVLAQDKDPYAKYDDPQNRRNFDEPLHHDEDLYDIWSPDYYSHTTNKSALKQNGVFFSLILGFAGALTYFELNPEKPAMPRSFPFGGLAKELGSGKDEDDELYRVRPDLTAEKELGFLAADPKVAENKKVYESSNAEFLKA